MNSSDLLFDAYSSLVLAEQYFRQKLGNKSEEYFNHHILNSSQLMIRGAELSNILDILAYKYILAQQHLNNMIFKIALEDCGHTGRIVAILNNVLSLRIKSLNNFKKSPYHLKEKVILPSEDACYQRAVPDINCPLMLMHYKTGKKIRIKEFDPLIKMQKLVEIVVYKERVSAERVKFIIGTRALPLHNSLGDNSILPGTVIVFYVN